MTGEIDQVDNVVRFIFDDEDAAWNSSIKYCCEQVNIKKKDFMTIFTKIF